MGEEYIHKLRLVVGVALIAFVLVLLSAAQVVQDTTTLTPVAMEEPSE